MSKADFIAIGLQQAGTAGLKVVRSTFDHTPPIQNEDITMQREELEAEETLGNRAPVAQDYGGRIFSGGISYFARPVSSPLFAAMAFGSPTSAAVAGGVNAKDHTFDPTATNKEPLAASIALIKSDVTPHIVDTLVGAKANEYNLSVEANGYLGGSVGVSAVRLLTGQTEPVGVAKDTTPKWSFLSVAAQIAVNGAALAPIALTNFGFTFTNNLVEDLFVLGDAEVDDIPTGNIGMETTFTPTKLLSSHYLRALKTTAPDDVRAQLVATGSVALGAAGDAPLRHELEIDLKRCQYTEAPINANAGETLRSVAVTARPVYDDTSSKLMLLRFRNVNVGTTYQPAP